MRSLLTQWASEGGSKEGTERVHDLKCMYDLEKGVFLDLRACALMQVFSLSDSGRGSLLVPRLVSWTRHSGVTKVVLSVWLWALLSPAGLPGEQLY